MEKQENGCTQSNALLFFVAAPTLAHENLLHAASGMVCMSHAHGQLGHHDGPWSPFRSVLGSCTLMLRYKTKRCAYEQLIVSEHIPITASQLQATTEDEYDFLCRFQAFEQDFKLEYDFLCRFQEADEYDFLCRFQLKQTNMISYVDFN
ncbi:hypothetical protein LXL04_037760 [Taraxacum kok-saghyz]